MKKKKAVRKEKIIVVLSEKDIAFLKAFIRSGIRKARAVSRARILLLSHAGKSNGEIRRSIGCAIGTISSVRMRYHDRGSVEAAISDAPRPGQPKKITAKHEAFVTATACTDAPPGHAHWVVEALRKKLLKTYPALKSVSSERIRQILVRSNLKPWREKNVVRA